MMGLFLAILISLSIIACGAGVVIGFVSLLQHIANYICSRIDWEN